MRFSVLSSGSRANCTFVEIGNTRLLIDCGLSAAQAAKRLFCLGVDPNSVSAIIVTHEHKDHIHGVSTFSKRHKTPIFANQKTSKHIHFAHGREKFITSEEFVVGEATIYPFPISHDADDPVGFLISARGLILMYLTDVGIVDLEIETHLPKAHSIILESNHDEEMLTNCGYPEILKERIRSNTGHLSNRSAGDVLKRCRGSQLSRVVLGHISENSNTPGLALDTVSGEFDGKPPFDLVCSNIYQPTPLFEVAA